MEDSAIKEDEVVVHDNSRWWGMIELFKQLWKTLKSKVGGQKEKEADDDDPKKKFNICVGLLISILIVVMAFFIMQICGPLCSTTLPQDVSKISPCYLIRKWSLEKQRDAYKIKVPTKTMPFARINKGIKGFMLFLFKKPFLWQNAANWINQAFHNKKLSKSYTEKTRRLPSIVTMADFAFIDKMFQLSSKDLKHLEEFLELPSEIEPFHTEKHNWISDELFAEQRLAGLSPVTLKRITFSDEIGVNWNMLKRTLNDKFDWNNLVLNVVEGKSLEEAISEGYLYVLHHPLGNDIKTEKEKRNKERHRKMWKYMSPIALFASVKGKKWWSRATLMPIAIQMDYKPESKVYTPKAGDLWTLAKLNVQLADLECNQIVEHLSKVHLVSEGLCLGVERQLSENHPLYAIMKYHCRGVFLANTFGAPVLLDPDRELDNMFPYGAKGANELVKRSSESYDWKDLNFETSIKRRGVNDTRRLPYYPYRDDGAEIHKVIKLMVTDYVDAYYRTDYDVLADIEVQNFANEVSDRGTEPGGAQIQIRGFPPAIQNKQQLAETVTQMIWLMSAQHAAVSYPLSDYAAYVPNMPSKLFDSKGVPHYTFSSERLPNREETADQVSFSLALASYRYDRLFDYYIHLDDPKGRAVVLRYFNWLNETVEPLLQKRNKKRLKHGHLTYPYMQPKWLTNGIQT